MSERSIVAIDQGTTSTRSIRYGLTGEIQASASRELPQYYPQSGWIEHNPEEIWIGALETLRAVLTDQVAALGITNQRETIMLWDRATGQVLHNALVWQDRRGADRCAALRAEGVEPMVRRKTGLLLDPYFSATKLGWLLDSVSGARRRAERGELAAGTVDTFLLWRLTSGRVHATDVTNASRTLLYDINAHHWDEELLELFGIPASILPTVHGNDHIFGATDPRLTGRAIPITGMAGDQQAALIGQRCFSPGMVKATYGTGGFLLVNIGATPVFSKHRLLTTVAYRMGGQSAYAIEGSLFVAGAAIKWLRDRMGLIGSAEETAQLAASVPANHGVHLVPAFVGLGAPHWRADVRASITGMTLDTGPAHLVRATLESIAYQTCDLIETLIDDGVALPSLVRIDGGMANNNWFSQFLADMLGLPVERPTSTETTALGAAILAGLGAQLWPNQASVPVASGAVTRFEPQMNAHSRASLLQAWHAAVHQLLAAEPPKNWL